MKVTKILYISSIALCCVFQQISCASVTSGLAQLSNAANVIDTQADTRKTSTGSNQIYNKASLHEAAVSNTINLTVATSIQVLEPMPVISSVHTSTAARLHHIALLGLMATFAAFLR